MNSFFGVVLILLAVNSSAYASSLGLDTEPPIVESSFAFIDYFEFFPDGDLSTFGAVVDFTDGASPVGVTKISFGVGFDLADPTAGATGGFDILDENGLFLGGDLLAVGFSNDVIEFQFGSLTGAGAGNFNSSVLMVIAFDDVLGANPFASLIDGNSYVASISIANVKAASPVPEPTGLPLFALGLALVGWFSRRRRW